MISPTNQNQALLFSENHCVHMKQDVRRAICKVKTWSPHSCNGREHRCKHISDSVLSSFDTHEHFDYNIASLTGIAINCSVSSNCNDRNNH